MKIKISDLNSLIALLVVFLFGYSALIILHVVFAKIIDDLDNKVENEHERYKIGKFILEEIKSIENNYYKMAIKFKASAVTPLQKDIREELKVIKNAIDVLEHGGTLRNTIKLNLVGISESEERITFSPSKDSKYTFEAIDLEPKLAFIEKNLDDMKRIIALKDVMLSSSSEEIKNDAKFEIQLFFKQIPSIFTRMEENAGRLLYESKINLEKLKKNIQKEKDYYSKLELITISLVMFFVGVLGYIVIKLIINKNKDLRKITLQARESAKEALKANQIKSQFLANMSHEIRTPLNAIIGFSEILSNTKLSVEDKRKALVINESAKSLLNIINDILDISKVESGKFELSKGKIDLKKLLEQTIELYSIGAREKNIKFIYKLIGDVPKYIYTDETRLKQVLSNLISNAIKFTPENKEVSFEVSVLKISKKNVTLKFLVKDQGIGISKENQEKIFKPFSQADGSITRKFGGTGLGLSISLKIINLMNSKIELLSEENKGSSFFFKLFVPYEKNELKNIKYKFLVCNKKNDTENLRETLVNSLKDYGAIYNEKNLKKSIDFIFCFKNNNLLNKLKKLSNKYQKPIVYVGDKKKIKNIDEIDSLIDFYMDTPIFTSKILNIITQSYSANKDVLNKKIVKTKFQGKILIAEDNKNNQFLMRTLLENLGLDVDIVENGQMAFEKYKEKKYDLVFLDINMPVIDGLKTLKVIRDFEKENKIFTPIIALTANTIKGDREKYLKAGMNAYLAKPIESAELIYLLENYLKNSFQNQYQTKKENISKNKIDTKLISKKLDVSIPVVEKIVEKFKNDIKKDLDEFEKIINSKNQQEIKEKAHYLKNSCLNLYLTELCSILQEFENANLSDREKEEKFNLFKQEILKLI